MSCVYLQLSDYGVAFDVTITRGQEPWDISDATGIFLAFSKPNNVNVIGTAEFITDGTDGQIRYVAESGFLDVAGRWEVQAHIITPDGAWRSTMDHFKVNRNIV